MPKGIRGFQKGASGNPAGRRPNESIHLLLKAMDKYVPGIIEMLGKATLGGDIAAAKLLLDRRAPILRPQSMTITLDSKPDSTLSEQGQNILNAILSGKIPPDVGS